MAQYPLPFHKDSNGQYRPLGLVPPLLGSVMPVGEFLIPTIPESEWQEFDLTTEPGYPLVIKDQNGKGACNGHATAEAMELSRWLHGQPHVPLSGWFPYAILCGGWDRGSTISEALSLIQKTGLAPETQVAYGTINPTKLSKEAYDVATNFKAEVGIALDTWEQIMSAVQLRMGGIDISIKVPNLSSWDLDSEGVVPVASGMGNHAICAGHGAKKLKDGRWAIKWQNSWTDQWGNKGYAWYTQNHWEKQSGREAYVIRTPAENQRDDSNPPVSS
jgi:C1A family cysteine protease